MTAPRQSRRSRRPLALWRGPAWADMLDLPPANAEAQRLDDQRVEALESRVEIELALGRGRDLVSELERLVIEHPLRERLIHSLMLALYRAGRQTDALDVFRAARERLVDELGLEPGPELHELQRRILSTTRRSAHRVPSSRSRFPARPDAGDHRGDRGRRGRGCGRDHCRRETRAARTPSRRERRCGRGGEIRPAGGLSWRQRWPGRHRA